MYGVNGRDLSRHYKHHISNYHSWGQLSHADDYVLFKHNMGEHLSMDETCLSQGELYTIVTNKFDSQRLELVRDMFAFSCYTGLSYIDVSGLTTDHIQQDNNGNLWVMTKRQKTKVPINIRLLEIPRHIIEKYEGAGRGDKLFPMPWAQKNNGILPISSTSSARSNGYNTARYY